MSGRLPRWYQSSHQDVLWQAILGALLHRGVRLCGIIMYRALGLDQAGSGAGGSSAGIRSGTMEEMGPLDSPDSAMQGMVPISHVYIKRTTRTRREREG